MASAVEAQFEATVRCNDLADFKSSMLRPTSAEHCVDDAKLSAMIAACDWHLGERGA
jgi:hypothetical protein